MDSRDDKKIEQIVNAGKPARLEPTLEMVKHEAVRRCVEDGQARVVYAMPDGSLRIRLPLEDTEGDQTSLCFVDGIGGMVIMGDDFDTPAATEPVSLDWSFFISIAINGTVLVGILIGYWAIWTGKVTL